MTFSQNKKWLLIPAAIALAVILWRWLLPVALPFCLGALIAWAAEPPVGLLCRKLRCPRGIAAAIGVTLVLLALLSLLVLFAALLVRQLTGLGGNVPQFIDATRRNLSSLEELLMDLSDKAPKSVRPLLHKTVDDVFSDGGAVLDSVVQRLPAAASALVSHVTDSALALGTACISAYMLSARLPRLRLWLREPPEDSLRARVLPRIRRIRSALWGWLKAQAKLSGICFLILLTGFLLLRIGRAPLWAALIALVDAVPLLGTGTVLVPWALVCFLQENTSRALGLLVIYAVALLSRSALEPRLVGSHLGLDPLLTLISLYAGYRFWGIGGMLAAPILCVIVKEATSSDGS